MHHFPIRALLFAFVFTCACVDPDGSRPDDDDPPDTSAQRFAAFDRWEIRYTYEQSAPFTFVEDGYTTWALGATVTYATRRASITGTIPLEVASVDEQYVILRGTGPVTASLDERWTSRRDNHFEERYDHGAGTALDSVDVVLELAEGRYDVSFHPGDFETRYGGIHGPVDEPISYRGTGTSHVGLPYYDYDERPHLPDTGTTLTSSFSWEQYWMDELADEPSTVLERRYRHTPQSGTLRWTLVPVEPLDVELVVVPEDYEDFMPQGGANEGTPGNGLRVRAVLRGTEGGEPRLHATSMRFDLVDVSRERGVSLNRPLTGGTDAPDLGFPATQPASGVVISNEGQHAEVEGEDDVTVLVGAYDWGASGALQVTAVLSNGRMVVGRLEGAPDTDTALRIPRRAQDSRIADAWKALVGFSGADDEDADVQPGNPNAGDGLSAYEEYRGMQVRGMHSRQQMGVAGVPLLRPSVKDLVVENRIGARARRGLGRFQISGITVVELAQGELEEGRLIAPNRGGASLGEQYGLRMVAEDLPDGVSGENRPLTTHGKTPRRSTLVVFDIPGMEASYAAQAARAAMAGIPMPYTLEQEIENTIAHELAHGIGAPHHGRPTDYRGPTTITAAMTSWHAYGADGIEIMTRPLVLGGLIGRPGNDASGDAGCIMAYTNVYSWAAVGTFEPYAFYMTGIQPMGEHFCASGEATGMNVPHAAHGGTQVPGFFGASVGQGEGTSAGNCLGAMRVRDF